MDTPRRPAVLVSLIAEFVAIFAGVVLALYADGWAERRSESQEAEAGLGLVLADLREDSVQFVAAGRKMVEWRDAAAWLILEWDRADLPSDSVADAFDALTLGETLHLSRVGFDGLRDANRLRFIASPGVQSGLREYYQLRQPQVASAFGGTIDLGDELYRLAAPHVRYGNETNVRAGWPLARAGVSLRHPWVETSHDHVLHQAILQFGRWNGYMVEELQAMEVLLGELSRTIQTEVDRPD